MSLNRLLGAFSALLPEGRAKTVVRQAAYAGLRRICVGSRTVTYRGTSFRMYTYPFLGGTGFEAAAMDGYLADRDIQPGDVVVDCGAYSGDFTLYAALRTGPQGLVLAFEPDITSRYMLERNIRLNNMGNVRVIPKGVWSEDGTMAITGTAFASELSTDTRTYSQTIAVCALDAELQRQQVPTAHFVKMDIEGAEVQALAGMPELLRRHPHLAIATYHVRDGRPTSEMIENALRQAGYQPRTGNPAHLTTIGP